MSSSLTFQQSILRVIVARICYDVGWDSAHQSTLNVLADILNFYLRRLSSIAVDLANHAGRTQPTFDDLLYAFKYLAIDLNQIKDYILNIKSSSLDFQIPIYPIVNRTRRIFDHCDPDEERPEYYYEWLPSLKYEIEDVDEELNKEINNNILESKEKSPSIDDEQIKNVKQSQPIEDAKTVDKSVEPRIENNDEKLEETPSKNEDEQKNELVVKINIGKSLNENNQNNSTLNKNNEASNGGKATFFHSQSANDLIDHLKLSKAFQRLMTTNSTNSMMATPATSSLLSKLDNNEFKNKLRYPDQKRLPNNHVSRENSPEPNESENSQDNQSNANILDIKVKKLPSTIKSLMLDDLDAGIKPNIKVKEIRSTSSSSLTSSAISNKKEDAKLMKLNKKLAKLEQKPFNLKFTISSEENKLTQPNSSNQQDGSSNVGDTSGTPIVKKRHYNKRKEKQPKENTERKQKKAATGGTPGRKSLKQKQKLLESKEMAPDNPLPIQNDNAIMTGSIFDKNDAAETLVSISDAKPKTDDLSYNMDEGSLSFTGDDFSIENSAANNETTVKTKKTNARANNNNNSSAGTSISTNSKRNSSKFKSAEVINSSDDSSSSDDNEPHSDDHRNRKNKAEMDSNQKINPLSLNFDNDNESKINDPINKKQSTRKRHDSNSSLSSISSNSSIKSSRSSSKNDRIDSGKHLNDGNDNNNEVDLSNKSIEMNKSQDLKKIEEKLMKKQLKDKKRHHSKNKHHHHHHHHHNVNENNDNNVIDNNNRQDGKSNDEKVSSHHKKHHKKMKDREKISTPPPPSSSTTPQTSKIKSKEKEYKPKLSIKFGAPLGQEKSLDLSAKQSLAIDDNNNDDQQQQHHQQQQQHKSSKSSKNKNKFDDNSSQHESPQNELIFIKDSNPTKSKEAKLKNKSNPIINLQSATSEELPQLSSKTLKTPKDTDSKKRKDKKNKISSNVSDELLISPSITVIPPVATVTSSSSKHKKDKSKNKDSSLSIQSHNVSISKKDDNNHHQQLQQSTTILSSSSSSLAAPSSSCTVVTETINVTSDSNLWLCPLCNKPDDGTPMIGCDTCDQWYHYYCLGIDHDPNPGGKWFCPRCYDKQKRIMEKAAKKQEKLSSFTNKSKIDDNSNVVTITVTTNLDDNSSGKGKRPVGRPRKNPNPMNLALPQSSGLTITPINPPMNYQQDSQYYPSMDLTIMNTNVDDSISSSNRKQKQQQTSQKKEICPKCQIVDNNLLVNMIGCDQCLQWYHWPCVGINTPPSPDSAWFCPKCVKKKSGKRLWSEMMSSSVMDSAGDILDNEHYHQQSSSSKHRRKMQQQQPQSSSSSRNKSLYIDDFNDNQYLNTSASLSTSIIPSNTIVDQSKQSICGTCKQHTKNELEEQWIACDICDQWYHFVCENIVTEPDPNEDWFCRHCIKKQRNIENQIQQKVKRKF